MEKEFSIEEVLDDIRREIKEKGLTADMLSFSDVVRDDEVCLSEEEAESCLSNLSRSSVIPESRRLEGNPLIVFIKRVIRRLTRFYIRPIVDAQNEFNAYAVRAAQAFNRQAGGARDVKRLEARVAALELGLQAAASENKMLISRIAALEAITNEALASRIKGEEA